ncbi:hypothetical protein [Hymenobacter arizonensis]|uniref:Uncharacterized protein n=1 Tax=Hymenobacter arizonensis TaxID=1227077 RepID=A0A1I5T7B1_HYMAR|nr:hypothetical protein [Hymenobacter arizonensis]SFP78922.1 hypothetical protein SAMN04515668_0347 [Hymenobacter arizonensis]
MSILTDHLNRFSGAQPGERQYEELINKCEALRYNHQQPRALLIGSEILASIEAFLTERNTKPMTLQSAGFGAGRNIPIIIDEDNPLGVMVLVEG